MTSKPAALDQLRAAVGLTQPPKTEPVLAAAPKTKDDKFKALRAVEVALNKQFDTSNSIVRLGKLVGKPMPSLSIGLPTFDNEVIQTGGVPDGRIIEIFGPESSGKTTLALHVVAEAQRQGDLAAFVDAEHALDPNYASKLGVNVDELLVSQPDSGEQALETVIALIHSRSVRVIVIDSVAALVPQAELDGEMGDSHMGLQARMMSQAMRKIRGIASKANVTVIFINQIREKIGVMFGNPETTTGGRALKFYSSVRLDVRRVSKTNGGEILSGGVLIGHKMTIKAVKNKVGTPFRDTNVDLIYGIGFDKEADLVQYAVNLGVIQKTGAWFKFVVGEKEVSAQGLEKLKDLLVNDPKALAALNTDIAKARAAQKDAEADAA